MFLILTLIILVAAFNIITGITMLVKSKGRDIAILRTMGATPGAIMRVFIVQGSLIGILGTLGGLALGVLIANGFEYMLSGRYWISFFPGLALLATIVCINLVGDQLRDVLNPRLSK